MIKIKWIIDILVYNVFGFVYSESLEAKTEEELNELINNFNEKNSLSSYIEIISYSNKRKIITEYFESDKLYQFKDIITNGYALNLEIEDTIKYGI